MGSIEENIFTQHTEAKPRIYTRYIDDIFITTECENDVNNLINLFRENSLLNFTHEMEKNQQIPFLDLLINRSNNSFSTSVYVKDTNLGFCLNGKSECPDKYRRSVVNSFVKRALSHSSSWAAVHSELERVSQMLSNNGYASREINEVIAKRLDLFMTPKNEPKNNNLIQIYYKNQISSAYKEDEKTIKKIIQDNVFPTNTEDKLNLIIYYKSKKTSNLLLKNSCLPPLSRLQETSLVYEYTCKLGDCSHLPSKYIGSTITTLSRRLTAHLQDGAIRRHVMNEHKTILTREQLEENTTIIEKSSDTQRLRMTEAVIIHINKPKMNNQLLPELSLPSMRKPSFMVPPLPWND